MNERCERYWTMGVIGLALAMTVGCSSAEPEETGADESAINAEEAADQRRAEGQTVTAGPTMPASEESRSLGVASWSSYAVVDAAAGFAGVVSFAVREDGQVAYAISVDARASRWGLAKYDAAGPTSEAISEADYAILARDYERVRAGLRSYGEQGGGGVAPQSRTGACVATAFLFASVGLASFVLGIFSTALLFPKTMAAAEVLTMNFLAWKVGIGGGLTFLTPLGDVVSTCFVGE